MPPSRKFSFYELTNLPANSTTDGYDGDEDIIVLGTDDDGEDIVFDTNKGGLYKRKGGGGGKGGGFGKGKSPPSAASRATAKFPGGRLGDGGWPRPNVGLSRGSAGGPPTKLSLTAPATDLLRVLYKPVQQGGLYIYAQEYPPSGPSADSTALEFCQEAQKLSEVSNCTSIDGVPRDQFINETQDLIPLAREANNSIDSINILRQYGARLGIIADSDCVLNEPLRSSLPETHLWIEDPMGYLWADLNLQVMCTEQDPELPDTSISSRNRDKAVKRGTLMGEALEKMRDKAKLDGHIDDTTTVADFVKELNDSVVSTAARPRSDFTDVTSRREIISNLEPQIQ